MKALYEHDLGGDGAKVGVYAEGGMIELKVGYPVSKLVDPIIAKLDPLKQKIEDLVPGHFEDAVLDSLVAGIKAEIVKLLSE